MKIFTGKQLSEWDRYTIRHEPIASIDLMERAAGRLADALQRRVPLCSRLTFFVGKGNNGGDGLAMARILSNKGFVCRVALLFPDSLNDNCTVNLSRLPDSVSVTHDPYCIDSPDDIVVDTILGSGFVGEASGKVLEVIHYINSLPNYTVSIDLPSAMNAEFGNKYADIVHADLTLTIECPKLAFMLPEAGNACGDVECVGIGLNDNFRHTAETPFNYSDRDFIDSLLTKKRDKFSHKGNYGHTLLICGSEGMAGAAFLATGAALRSGCGYVTAMLPQEYIPALAAAYPSALTIGEDSDHFDKLPVNIDKYTSLAVGCGLGQHSRTIRVFEQLLDVYRRPMVIDADAINIISSNTALLGRIPNNSILTPHIGEFRRLVGQWADEREKIAKARELAEAYSVVVVLKGAYTMVCLPDGSVWFNSTGNAFMAKAGSGDVLTGLLAGLLARGYTPADAARIGVYYHGLAGEAATDAISGESFCSDDIIRFIRI